MRWESLTPKKGMIGRSQWRYGSIVAVIDQPEEDEYEWSVRLDDANGLELRRGRTVTEEDQEKKAWDRACHEVHQAVRDLFDGLRETLVQELAAAKAGAKQDANERYARGFVDGVEASIKTLRTKATLLRDEARAMDDAASAIDAKSEDLKNEAYFKAIGKR